MCIIAISEIGKALPDKETMRTMWDCNPDGAGFMYNRRNKVHIHKGFMTFDDFINAIDSLSFDPKDVQFIIHFRIGTHGGNTPQNTHPFPVTRKVKNMQALEFVTDCAFMHNGIIHSVEMLKNSISDTMEYDRQILADLYDMDKQFYKRKSIQILIEESINGSRMVFLNGKGEIVRLGDWVKEDGIWYSNSTFKPRLSSLYDWDDSRSRWWNKKWNGNIIDDDNSKLDVDGNTFSTMLYYAPDNGVIKFENGDICEADVDTMCDINGNVYLYELEDDLYEAYFTKIEGAKMLTADMREYIPDPDEVGELCDVLA